MYLEKNSKIVGIFFVIIDAFTITSPWGPIPPVSPTGPLLPRPGRPGGPLSVLATSANCSIELK